MSQYLMEVLQASNPQVVEKYVANHLPNDAVALERIYRELKEYKINVGGEDESKKETITVKTERKRKNEPKPKQKKQPEGDQLKHYADRSNAMMRMLKDKGLKVMHQNQLEEGMGIFEVKKDRLTKPLLMNSKVIKAGNPIMNSLIERYNINRKFYNNDVEDVVLKGEDIYDPEMKKFIERRKQILFQLRQGGNKEKDRWATAEKYKATEHKVYRETQLTGIDAVISRKRSMGALSTMSSLKSQINLSSKNLISSCTAVLSQKTDKLFHQNAFQPLAVRQAQAQAQDQEEQEMFLSEEFALMQKAKIKHKNDQFQRYNHSYMKMMSHGQKTKQCKLNSHAKALLKDEIRMRHVIDFSKKQ